MLIPVTPAFTQSAPFPSATPLVVVKTAGTLPPASLALKSSAAAPDARFPASEIVVGLFAEIDTGDVELREAAGENGASQNVHGLELMSDYRLTNKGTLMDLLKAVDGIVPLGTSYSESLDSN